MKLLTATLLFVTTLVAMFAWTAYLDTKATEAFYEQQIHRDALLSVNAVRLHRLFREMRASCQEAGKIERKLLKEIKAEGQ